MGSDEARKRLKRERLLESGARHRPELNGLAVDIVGVGADPEGDSNTIVLVMPNHVIVKPRRRPYAYAEHPRRQRIERPCMTDTTLPEDTANPIDHVMRAHSRGLVHPHDERKARLSPLSCHEYPFNTTRKRVIPLSDFHFIPRKPLVESTMQKDTTQNRDSIRLVPELLSKRPLDTGRHELLDVAAHRGDFPQQHSRHGLHSSKQNTQEGTGRRHIFIGPMR